MKDKAKGTVDSRQVDGIIGFLQARPEMSQRLSKENATARSHLAQTEPSPYHAGLRHLGSSLGFQVTGEHADGASDCVWHLGSIVYCNFEAKTAKTNDCLSQEEIRQIKEQLGDIAANDGLTVPIDLKTTCVTTCASIASRKGHDLDKFDVARPIDVLEFATDWFSKLEEIQRQGTKDPSELRKTLEIALVNHGASLDGLRSSLKIQPAGAVISVQPKPRAVP